MNNDSLMGRAINLPYTSDSPPTTRGEIIVQSMLSYLTTLSGVSDELDVIDNDIRSNIVEDLSSLLSHCFLIFGFNKEFLEHNIGEDEYLEIRRRLVNSTFI